jgi:Tat protein translocase TatB subunit
MPSSLGPAEILMILVVALIVLGPKRLPEAGRQIGRALAEVRRWSQDMQTELRDAVDLSTVEKGPEPILPPTDPPAPPQLSTPPSGPSDGPVADT